jgi:hypothetical protein
MLLGDTTMKKGLAILVVVLIVLGFLSWRLDFRLPILRPQGFFILGLLLAAGLIWGRIIAPVIGGVALISLVIGVGRWMLIKGTQWHDIAGFFTFGIAGFVVAAVLGAMGSGTMAAMHEAKAEHRRKSVVCAKCDQYLGTADGFKTPCPRCGSNRYTLEN